MSDPLLAIAGLCLSVVAIANIRNSWSTPKLVVAVWGLPEYGIEFPDKGLELVSLVTYRNQLALQRDEAEDWMRENPAYNEPLLSRWDKAKLWCLTHASRIRKQAAAVVVLAGLTWAAVAVIPRIKQYYDAANGYGLCLSRAGLNQERIYCTASNSAYAAPHWLIVTAWCLAGFAVGLMLMAIIVGILSRLNRRTRAHCMWMTHEDDREWYQGKIAAIAKELERVDDCLSTFEGTVRRIVGGNSATSV